MSNVVPLAAVAYNPMPEDFPGMLRELADARERGEVAAFVGMYLSGGAHPYMWPSSYNDSLLLASLLQHRAAARYGAGEP